MCGEAAATQPPFFRDKTSKTRRLLQYNVGYFCPFYNYGICKS